MEVIDPVTGERRQIEGDAEDLAALKALADLVEAGTQGEVSEATGRALDRGIAPFDVLLNGLQAGLAVVGERFKRNEAFIPEVLLSARAMHKGMDILRPLLAELGNEPEGKVVLGTVEADLHDIGKNMVGMMLEGAGFQVIDVGVNVRIENFVDAVKEEDADILALSALLSTTMHMQGETIEALAAAGLRDRVKVMLGGAPVTAEYAKAAGADAFAPDAARAVDVARELMNAEAGAGFFEGAT